MSHAQIIANAITRRGGWKRLPVPEVKKYARYKAEQLGLSGIGAKTAATDAVILVLAKEAA